MDIYKPNILTTIIAIVITLVTCFAFNVLAQTNTGTHTDARPAAESFIKGKYGYVTISGTVSKILDKDRFELNYGNGVTQIYYDEELHNLFKKSAHKLKLGDTITVTGKIDKNWFTKREIVISSIIHIKDDYILLYKRPAVTGAEMPATVGVVKPSLFLDGQAALTGIVREMPHNNSFTLQYEDGVIKVDASNIKIPDNNRITQGDIVTIYGTIDNSFFKEQKISAETIEKIGIYSRTSSGN